MGSYVGNTCGSVGCKVLFTGQVELHLDVNTVFIYLTDVTTMRAESGER